MSVHDEIHEALTKDFHNDTGNEGGFVTGWVLCAETIHPDGETGWMQLTAEGQRPVTSMGLVKWLQGVLEYEQATTLRRNLEE